MVLMAISRKVLSVSSGLFTDEVLETVEPSLWGGQTSTVAVNDKLLPDLVNTSDTS